MTCIFDAYAIMYVNNPVTNHFYSKHDVFINQLNCLTNSIYFGGTVEAASLVVSFACYI